MIKAVIFDMDGVLVDSEPFHAEIEKSQFERNKIAITEEEHRQYLGVASAEMWKQITERHALHIPAEELVEQNRAESIRFFSKLAEIPTMPGIHEILEIIRNKNYPLGVASSSFPEIIELVLKNTGMRNYFDVVVSTQEVGKSKPAPDVYLLAAKKLGVEPENCLVVEDSENGIKAAQSAGMKVVAYLGEGAPSGHEKNVDAAIHHHRELETML